MPLLLLLGAGVVAYLLLQQGASASTLSTTGWPPSQAVQQGLVNQFSAMASATLGRPLTPQEATNIGNGVAQAPQEYVATLAGAAPTVAGYQTWALTQLYGALMATSQFAATTSSMVTG